MLVSITIEDRNGQRQQIEVPDDMNLSLMEAMKAYEYNILATCGGMALCATCHVQVLEGKDQLSALSDAELDMLDTLPDAAANSRLACQLRIDKSLENAVFRICGQEHE
ncbi:2Fe-2S iron-sulfur cluster-binding protein [Niabella beijingensis]|uniref:2Fe-2S iron-sulfur cluster-binding protein n=1 Tax=Niabella beijingensis TaxID=2872700 RepID=UPI001CBB726B|nr:2Fe-2S iron-sulfur cluster-binding protein [Niabella beijingensis]MBZ4191998.1 (2Fe-2S)-binding protein [Niabella beijingensis]